MLRTVPSLAVLLLAGAGGMALAAAALAQGDGSGTDNPNLLRGSVGVGCTPGTLCHFLPFDPNAPAPAIPMAPPPVSAPAPYIPPTPAPPAPAPMASPVVDTAPMIVVDDGLPRAFDTEYGLTLRGTYVRSDGRDRFEMLAIPQVTLERSAAATDFALSAQAAVVAPTTDDTRLASAALDASAVHRLSPSAALTFTADLDFSQDDANGLSVDDANVARAPQRVGAGFDVAYGQRFGQFDLLATGNFSRQWTGATTFADGSQAQNAHEDVLGYGGGLRVGYAVTPIVGAFVSGSAGREDFAAADPDIGAVRSGDVYDLRAGITGNWSDRVTLEASIGSGWRDYDSPLIDDARAWLYGVSLAYAPTTTTQLSAALQTRLDAGSGTSGARESYDLTLAGNHRVNPWIALRASALAGWDVPVDGAAVTRRYEAGAGADFLVGPRTTAAIDYSYGWREDPSADPVIRDEHRISGGLTLRY